MVRSRLDKDYLAFRRGEEFPLLLQAGRLARAYDVHFVLVDPETKQTVRQWIEKVPPGEVLFEKTLSIPTDREGAFDLRVTDAEGKAMDRTVQFLVVDTQTPPKCPPKLEKELVQQIDCARQPPDYAHQRHASGASAAGRLSRVGDARPLWTAASGRLVRLHLEASLDPRPVPRPDRLSGRRSADLHDRARGTAGQPLRAHGRRRLGRRVFAIGTVAAPRVVLLSARATAAADLSELVSG